MTIKTYCPLILALSLAYSVTLWADTSEPESRVGAADAETLTSQASIEEMATETKLADNAEPDSPKSWSVLWE